MFSKGIMRDNGIDITIKNNPGHILSPDNWEMVIKMKLRKINPEEYKSWYKKLIAKRWKTRKDEFIKLAQEGISKDIKLKCFCKHRDKFCHAYIAADIMNNLVKRISESNKVDREVST